MHTAIKIWLFFIAMALLQGCGGGSDGGDEPPPDMSVFVYAGPDRSVTENVEVTLEGEARSNDESLTYTWSAAPALSITHADKSTSAATFTAPSVTEDTNYTLTLVVTGAAGGRGSDEQIITVVPANLAPVAAITTPTFTNVTTGFLPAGASIVLSSELSSDADAPDMMRQIRGWNWQQTAGLVVLNESETNQPTHTFTAPVLDERETLSFDLTVTDAEGATDTVSVDLTVLAANETPPVVAAGLDQFVFVGETIVLAGSASSTVNAALPLSIVWESSSQVVINNPHAADTFATAPDLASATEVVMVLTVVDSFGNQVEDSLLVNVRPNPIPTLNDTGVIMQGTESELRTSQQNAYPGQDSQRGQDRVALNGLLEKAGRGRVGFDFTPLNSNGDEMDNQAEPWSCVRDNTTGFVWEVKSAEAGLHNANATYSWFLEENNGGFEGDLNGQGTSCSLSECNTQAFITAVNSMGLCGFYDWRLPNHDELMSIIDFGTLDGAKIDETYFPYLGTVDNGPIWYWTSQPGADGVAEDAAQNAWALDFSTGVDNFLNKSTPVRVRLVRAGR